MYVYVHWQRWMNFTCCILYMSLQRASRPNPHEPCASRRLSNQATVSLTGSPMHPMMRCFEEQNNRNSKTSGGGLRNRRPGRGL